MSSNTPTEIINEAIEGLETRLKEYRQMRGGSHRCRNIDRFYIGVLLDYVKEQRAREPLYQGYDAGTSPGVVERKFFDRYGRSPREIHIKNGAVLAGPISEEEHKAKCNLTNS